MFGGTNMSPIHDGLQRAVDLLCDFKESNKRTEDSLVALKSKMSQPIRSHGGHLC